MHSCSIAVASMQRVPRIDRRGLIRLARSVLAREMVHWAEISVAVVDDPQIHAVNREFLKHDEPTDVISFLLDGSNSTGRQPRPAGGFSDPACVPAKLGSSRRSQAHARRRGAGKMIGGEIVMMLRRPCESARELNANPADELARILYTACCICAVTTT